MGVTLDRLGGLLQWGPESIGQVQQLLWGKNGCSQGLRIRSALSHLQSKTEMSERAAFLGRYNQQT